MTLRQYLGFSGMLALVLMTSIPARADLTPDGRGAVMGSGVYRCAVIAGTGNGPNQTKMQGFLHDPAYSWSSEPEVTKIGDGKFQVCAIFRR